MSYNMWFLTPAITCAPAGEWIDFVRQLSAEGDEQRAERVEGAPKDWRQIHVSYPDGGWSFDFERYSVGGAGGRWTDDLSFFRGWLGAVEPAVNTQWLTQYVARVRTVYMFQCSNSAPESSLDLVNEIVDSLRHDDENAGGHSGLLYAELEGWSNEDGYHVTWEFSDRASGPWQMALRGAGGWDVFQVELSDRAHRRAFKAGKVPPGVASQFRSD